MSNMTQLFDASRFPGHVKVQSAGKAAVMTFCRKGRCEVALEDGEFAFLSQGHMAVGTQLAQEEYRYPSGLYEGVELFLDLDMLAHRPYPLF